MAYSAKSQAEYNKKMQFYTIKLSKENDKEIIDFIEKNSKESKQKFIKSLIEKEMNKGV